MSCALGKNWLLLPRTPLIRQTDGRHGIVKDANDRVKTYENVGSAFDGNVGDVVFGVHFVLLVNGNILFANNVKNKKDT